jgi:carboxypeptidase T
MLGPRRIAVLLAVGLATVFPHGAGAATGDFPRGWEGFHTYAEMSREVAAVAAAHPSIVRRFSIGKSYQGRELWAAKVSDYVWADEREPEVLFDGLHHAREHMSLEMTLAILHWLVDGYGRDSKITALVNTREIWIIFAVNPDGAEYDISGGQYHLWRKNRQPTPGSSYIGTDLNRNYDYHWGCCGGSSGNPRSITYRGRRPFSAPETRVVRDFVNSRVINGRQQIRAHITFHTNGELVLWPYGYTRTDVPYDMTTADRNALARLGRGMAARNGYTAMQSSSLYITDGDEIDWMYGVHRIFSYTWELYPTETPTVWGDHYPPDEKIATQTARNRKALLYLIDQAGCVYEVIDKVRQNCGPLFDDLEIDRGWRLDPDGTDTATSGRWHRGNPESTSVDGTPYQLGTTNDGSRDLATGSLRNGGANANDVDGGKTTVRSAPVDLPGTPGPLTFRYYFAHGADSSPEDAFRVYVEEGATRTPVLERLGGASSVAAAWQSGRVDLSAWASKTVRIVFEATDGGGDSLVEAGVDDVRIERPS